MITWRDIEKETPLFMDTVAQYIKTKNLFKNYKGLIVYFNPAGECHISIQIYKSKTKLGVLYDRWHTYISPEELIEFGREEEYKRLNKLIPNKPLEKTKKVKI